jgi:hypothetical protein
MVWRLHTQIPFGNDKQKRQTKKRQTKQLHCASSARVALRFFKMRCIDALCSAELERLHLWDKDDEKHGRDDGGDGVEDVAGGAVCDAVS